MYREETRHGGGAPPPGSFWAGLENSVFLRAKGRGEEGEKRREEREKEKGGQGEKEVVVDWKGEERG